MTLKAFFPILGFATGMGIAAAGMETAQAATVTFSSKLVRTGSNGTASVQKFDTSLGTLNFVTIDYDLSAVFDLRFVNLSGNARTATVGENMIQLRGHDPSVKLLGSAPTEDRLLQFQFIGGEFEIPPSPFKLVSLGFVFEDSYDSRGTGGLNGFGATGSFNKNRYAGSGNFDFNFSAALALPLELSGLSNNFFVLGGGSEPVPFGKVTVTYDFTEAVVTPPSTVPVPAALPLLAVALGAIGLAARRKRTV